LQYTFGPGIPASREGPSDCLWGLYRPASHLKIWSSYRDVSRRVNIVTWPTQKVICPELLPQRNLRIFSSLIKHTLPKATMGLYIIIYTIFLPIKTRMTAVNGRQSTAKYGWYCTISTVGSPCIVSLTGPGGADEAVAWYAMDSPLQWWAFGFGQFADWGQTWQLRWELWVLGELT
jgi:hypothetical protein